MGKNEYVVIIPAYEPSANFIVYAKQLIDSQIAALVVVNDGSSEKYQYIFDELAELPNCKVLVHEKNGGKGFALKTALRYVKEKYDERFTFATADCDGQHLIEDVLNVSSVAADFGDSFVLGVRDFYKSNVPKRSKMGNITTRRVFRLLYGVKISDTQTGLRAFPYSLIDTLLRISGERFEYEMNQLVVLHKKSIPLREVPIATVYENKPSDVETVSHYKTFRDGARVAKVLFTNLSWFMVASVLSAIVEVLLCYFGLKYLPPSGYWIVSRAFLAQFIARLCSSVVNLFVNYKVVFNGRSKKSILKYYVLWMALFVSSLAYAHYFGKTFEKPSIVVLMTGISTILMSLLSYQIQTRWVFANDKRKKGKFWGLLARFCRAVYRLFKKPYTSLVAKDPQGVVYICRHLNMHGPMITASRIGFDVHIMAFSVFYTWRECFKHFRDYNFTVLKRMNRFNATICAFFTASFLVPLVRSLECIPVYRKNAQAIITLKRALKCLERHENLLLFPDIAYTADSETETDIYTGFLYLERLYYKKFNKHLRFIPLVIDESNRTIIEKSPIRFKNGDFKEELERVKNDIMLAINCKKTENSDDAPN